MPWLWGVALRSDDPDLMAAAAAAAAASPNADLETAAHPAAAAINMHRVTGTFADPTHESAFAAQLFRMAYPTHVLLMALVFANFTWNALMEPDMRAYWAVLMLCVALPGLACRVLLHRTGTHDPGRSQWMGSWAWTVLTALGFAIHTVGYIVAPAAKCAAFRQAKYMVPFMMLLTIMITGTHGLSFACKFGLMTIFLTNFIVGIATCHDPDLDPWFICTMGILVLGSATTHTAELYLRRSYAEKVQAKMQEQQSLTKEATRGRQLEERMEQLQTSNERLLYDVQRRGRPLDDDGDDRSAIRRGLLAGPSQPYPLTSNTDPSEAGGPAPSDSSPTLPPGPPSSASSGSVAPSLGPAQSSRSDVVPLSWVEADRQWHAENPGWARSVVADSAAGAATLATPTAPAAESICGEELMEKVLAEMGTDGDGTAAASTVHARACTTDHSPCPPRPPNLQSCPPCTMPRRSPWVTQRPWSSYSELSG